MLKDITIGQYFPMESPVHHLDARTKLLLCMAFIVILFTSSGIFAYALCAAGICAITLISKIKFRMLLKSLKPIIFLAIFTAALNMLYTPGDIIWQFWIFKVTTQGIRTAIYMVTRIIMLISATSLMTYTTSPMALTDAIETLLRPLSKMKMPVHEFAMMMTIALRFIPTLIEECDKIMSAQKARGADFESGNIIRRAKALVPVLVPLFISSFRRADELSVAMESRLYHGGEGRTKLKKLKFCLRDAAAFGISTAFFAAVIVCGRLLI